MNQLELAFTWWWRTPVYEKLPVLHEVDLDDSLCEAPWSDLTPDDKWRVAEHVGRIHP